MTIRITSPRPRTLMKDVQDVVTEVALLSVVPAVADQIAVDPEFAARVAELKSRSQDLAFALLKRPDAATIETGTLTSVVAAGMTVDAEMFGRKVRARRRMEALKKGARR